jgi:hypothetical protein
MNWTGGRLSRHSNAKRTLRARQKQHFAKVQANLRNGTKKPSPLKLSFLENPIESKAGSRHPSSSGNIPYSHERGEPIPPRRNSSIDLQVPHYNNLQLGSTPVTPQHKFPTDRELLLKRRLDSVPDDGLYSATPLPLERKRKYVSSIKLPAKESAQDQEESEFERRRRILRKGDWVGVRIQRPLQLVFASPNHVELVGRRRKVTESHQAKYDHMMQPFVRSPFGAPNRVHSNRNMNGGQDMAHLGTSDVRISIGGRVIPPGISSSSIPSGRRKTSIRSCMFEQSQGSSSDVMLLDSEDGARKWPRVGEEEFYSRREKPVNHANRPNYYNGERDPFGGNLAGDIRHDEYSYQSTRASVSNKGGSGNFYPGGEDTSTRQVPPIVSSSTTSLQHPIPQSSRTSHLLRSDSAEITASIIAQVGKAQPVVPSSQLVDNDIWESWVGPVFDGHSQEELDDRDRGKASMRQDSISAGISQGAGSHPAHRRMLSEYSYENLRPESGWAWSSKNDDLSQDTSVSLSVASGDLNERESPRSNMEVKEISSMGTPVGFHEGPRPKRTKEIDRSVKKQEASDLDNSWRRFVFGSSDDGNDVAENQCRKQPPAVCVQTRGVSPTSSMLPVFSTGNSM